MRAAGEQGVMAESLLDVRQWTHGPRRIEWEDEIRARARAVPVAGGLLLCRILGRYKLYIEGSDVGFGAHIALEGFWESWITQFVVRHIVPDSVVMDVGANHGYYTVVMADLVGPGGKVICFKPFPSTRVLLERNIEINGFSDWAVIDPRAVADASGRRVGMSCPPGEPKNARLEWSGGQDAVEVETLALDDLDAVDVDFVKVDVEGAEERMWAGMQRFLDRNPAVRLLLEFNRGRCEAPTRMLDEIASRFPLRHVEPSSLAVPVTANQILSAPPMDWMLYLSVRDQLLDAPPVERAATTPPSRRTRFLRVVGIARD
jgi:FkbM family methyltransferase